MVDPDTPEDVRKFGYDFHAFFPLPEFNALLFVDDLGVETIKTGAYGGAPAGSTARRQRRVTRCGFLSVDLATGHCKGSVYAAVMRGA